ncbi:dienelactone hydrolase family protein [Acidipila sp. EB88]|uniref:dienelactone hydrolase family protein n=1 Tax=Acidipila sp. EB88 TaxID=2305226 RepID=UPI000F5E7C53|nr:dienelactone hydrolase family protein [Acidipila sp. EB88]RRA48174.1 hypothetical protein D1Y84_07625 [Acidipila sp. EB88]
MHARRGGKRGCVLLLVLAIGHSAWAQQQRHSDTWSGQQQSQSWATQKVARSLRHGEWTQIVRGGRTLKAFVILPQTTRKAPVVIVAHEVSGLTDSTRNTADEIAAMGYIAIVPDMLSGRGPTVETSVRSRTHA